MITNYIWCGSSLCQARNSANAVIRGYYDEGEYTPGGLFSHDNYYAPDRLGSVRRVFTTTSSSTYDYDAYGAALQTTAPTTDFGYAGTVTNTDSGLYLTTARPYDPATGRFLTRDPIGEAGDPQANLYAYVADDPVDETDPAGLLGPWNLPNIFPNRQAPNPNRPAPNSGSPCPPSPGGSKKPLIAFGPQVGAAEGPGFVQGTGVALIDPLQPDAYFQGYYTYGMASGEGATAELQGTASSSSDAFFGSAYGGSASTGGAVSVSGSVNPTGGVSGSLAGGVGGGAYVYVTNTVPIRPPVPLSAISIPLTPWIPMDTIP